MGSVHEALQETIERKVAIKILRPEYAHDADITKRFFNEARAVNRIDHPSLVQIHEHGHLPDGTAYIVMEFLKGETLAQRLYQSGGRVPAALAMQIVWQVAAALTAAHDKSIVHRDSEADQPDAGAGSPGRRWRARKGPRFWHRQAGRGCLPGQDGDESSNGNADVHVARAVPRRRYGR